MKNQLPSNPYGKLKKLTEPGQEKQIDFNGKVHKKTNGDVQKLKGIDRFSKMADGKRLQNRRNERSNKHCNKYFQPIWNTGKDKIGLRKSFYVKRK